MKRLSGLAALLLMAVLYVTPNPAQAGSYEVRDCMPFTTGALGAFSSTPANGFEFENACGGNVDYYGYDIYLKPNPAYNQGDIGRVKFHAPSGIGITGIDAWVYTNLINDTQWSPKVVMHDAGANGVAVSLPYSGLGQISYDLPSGQARQDVEANLKCTTTTCVGRPTNTGFMDIGSVSLTVRDSTKPVAVSNQGTLYAGGVVSGSRTVEVLGTDGESGTWRIILMVNGQLVGYQDNVGSAPGVSCDPSTGSTTSFRPCYFGITHTWTVNTASAPFKNGANSVFACATDYSGESKCTDATTVYVSN
ncbi:MAG: hypothetical protein J0H98_00760 [Solirubrobacterales bacterium]|nr:hypothetical protein [Solirubrobacterales bacterium]